MTGLIDSRSLIVYQRLEKAFFDCADHFDPVGNMVGVFFHDLMIHFTGLLHLRAATHDYPGTAEFPFVNRSYAQQPFVVSEESYFAEWNSKNQSRKRLLEEKSVIPIEVGNGIPRNPDFWGIETKIIRILGAHRSSTRVYIPGWASQLDLMCDTILGLCREIEQANTEIILKNWQAYLGFHCTTEQPIERAKGAIVGTRCNLQNRKLATNFLQQNKEVIAFTHGEISNDIFDEPVYAYSERSLCSTLVDYGVDTGEQHKYTPLVRPRRTLRRSSPVIEKRFRRSSSIHLKDPKNISILYVPTLYSGNHMYGPFRNLEDAQYQEWQRALVSTLPSLTVKSHPKSRGEYQLAAAIDERSLETAIPDYDLLVIDYYSTAATLSLFSDKVVLLFDLGLRRLTDSFSEAISTRVVCKSINLRASLKPQIQDGLSQAVDLGKAHSNHHLEQYSLNHEPDYRLGGLLRSFL